VSQAILEQGTIRLDAYVDKLIPQMERVAYELTEQDGHSYSIYPLGTPLFSLPFVWIANLFGRDMSILDHNYRLQNDLSALLSALVFLVLYRIGRYYVSPPASLLIALISVLGSALISTVGTALWSVDLAVLFLALSMWILVRYQAGRAGNWDPYLLGSALFAAYFCRPTTVTLVVVALAFLFVTRRKEAIKAALSAVALLLPFVVFNWIEFGQPLSEYYYGTPMRWLTGRRLGQRLPDALAVATLFGFIYMWIAHRRHRTKLVVAAFALALLAAGFNWLQSGSPLPDLSGRRVGFGVNLYGVLFSPSRGFFVYSPFLVPVLLGSLLYWRRLGKPNLASVVLLSLGLHLLGLVATGVWHGGYAFGPRLMTDLLPALVLLTFLVWKAVSSGTVPRWRRIGATSYLLLGSVAVLINSYQGLLNANTIRWHGEIAPSLHGYRENLFDWKYPQFLATSRSLCDRNREYMLGRLQDGSIQVDPYRLGERITYGSGEDGRREMSANPRGFALTEHLPTAVGTAQALFPRRDYQVSVPMVLRTSRNAVFIGWLRPEAGYRWSVCLSSRILFELGDADVSDGELVLEIMSGSLGFQEVTVSVNGVQIGDVAFPGPEAPPVMRTLRFRGSLLRQSALNDIEFYVPNASSPDWGDDRTLGLAFGALRIRQAE
jgi:hypothetical protein